MSASLLTVRGSEKRATVAQLVEQLIRNYGLQADKILSVLDIKPLNNRGIFFRQNVIQRPYAPIDLTCLVFDQRQESLTQNHSAGHTTMLQDYDRIIGWGVA